MTEMTGPEIDPEGQRFEIDSALVELVQDAIEDENRDVLLALLDPLHSADIADLIEQIAPRLREDFFRLWGKNIEGEVLSELDESLREDLMDALSDDLVTEAVRDLETDDVVDLIEDLAAEQQERVLDVLDLADAAAVRRSLEYPDETAGRLMQRELVMAPSHWNVGETIDSLRRDKKLPDRFYDVVIVDAKLVPVGKVPLHALMSSPRKAKMVEIMEDDFRTISVFQPQEDVAYAFNQYNMVSTPVVDEDGRLVGVITIDDAMEILEEEAEEDIKRLAGVGEDESLTDTIFETTKQRFPWLFANLITSILASIVIAQFTETINAIVALAVLMPIVASMGGNAGTQTLTVAVRALATKDLTSANAFRVVQREVSVGFLNGLIFAVLIGGVGYLWYGSAMLGIVLGMAMIFNLLVAGLAGILVPIALERLRIDPALASSAFVTTVTDVVGFFVFLGLAAVMLL